MTTDNEVLPFTVVESSSATSGCEAVKLEQYDEDGDGWQSNKECNYPQVLTLKLTGKTAVIDAIEILSHEAKVPNKVDIDLGTASSNTSSFAECDSISHLGYIVFNQSDGESRELKSIPIGRKADLVRLTFHGCHEGPHNPHKQVGIAAIRVLSEEKKIDVPIGADTIRVQSAASSTLPLRIKNELDPKISASVDRLERLKKERAAAEDFDMAARIKQELGKVYALLIAFKESENQMKQAALDEDYVQASRLKAERDERRDAAKAALVEVEQQFAGNIENAANLSISTIKDQSFLSERSLRSKKEDQDNSYSSDGEESTDTTSTSTSGEDSSDDNGSTSHSGSSANDHPLAGVDGAEELPSPEDIETNAPTDLVHKVESLFGSYRAKCFFSKNWSLREACLAKMTLMIPEICSAGSTGGADISEIILSIIESSNSDKNVQVNLSGLILLDEALLQLETTSKAPISMTPQLSRILVDLFSKMADNSKKVADSAELSLLMLGYYDVSYVALLATKRVRSKEAKGGRTVRARLHFLENLSAEFGVDVAWKKIIDFAKVSKAFDHRDGSVRDAAKSLVMTLATIHGNDVFKSLEGDLAERQLREMRMGCQMVY